MFCVSFNLSCCSDIVLQLISFHIYKKCNPYLLPTIRQLRLRSPGGNKKNYIKIYLSVDFFGFFRELMMVMKIVFIYVFVSLLVFAYYPVVPAVVGTTSSCAMTDFEASCGWCWHEGLSCFCHISRYISHFTKKHKNTNTQ